MIKKRELNNLNKVSFGILPTGRIDCSSQTSQKDSRSWRLFDTRWSVKRGEFFRKPIVLRVEKRLIIERVE